MAAHCHDVQCQVCPVVIDKIDLSELDRGTPATHGSLHVTKRSRFTVGVPAPCCNRSLRDYLRRPPFPARGWLPRAPVVRRRSGGADRPGESDVGVFEGGRLLVSGATTCSRRALRALAGLAVLAASLLALAAPASAYVQPTSGPPFDGTPISPGLGPTYGETWCAQPAPGSSIANQQGAPLALVPYEAFGCLLAQFQAEAVSRGRAGPHDVLGDRPVRRRARPVRRRRQRDGDAGAAGRVPELAELPREGADRPGRRAGAPAVVRRQREDPDLRREQHPRRRGGRRGLDDADHPRPRHDAARDASDGRQLPRSRDPRHDPEPEPRRPLHRPARRTPTATT